MQSNKTLQELYKKTCDEAVLEHFFSLGKILGPVHSREGPKTLSFSKARIQYVEYLIICLVGSSLGIETAPPPHVELLLKFHLQQTESYRELEQFIVEYLKQRIDDGSILKNTIDHAAPVNEEDRKKKLENCKKVNKLVVGFDDFDVICDADSRRSDRMRSLPLVVVSLITILVVMVVVLLSQL